jgi:fluoride exporter
LSSFAAVTPLGLFAVAVGAVLGAWARWFLSLAFNGTHPWVPVGTLIANLAGGLLIGIALAWFSRHAQLDPAWRLLAVTGFLGALTTFSSFSAESLVLVQKGAIGWALTHSALHLVGCLLAAAFGYRLLAH